MVNKRVISFGLVMHVLAFVFGMLMVFANACSLYLFIRWFMSLTFTLFSLYALCCFDLTHRERFPMTPAKDYKKTYRIKITSENVELIKKCGVTLREI